MKREMDQFSQNTFPVRRFPIVYLKRSCTKNFAYNSSRGPLFALPPSDNLIKHLNQINRNALFPFNLHDDASLQYSALLAINNSRRLHFNYISNAKQTVSRLKSNFTWYAVSISFDHAHFESRQSRLLPP